MMHGQKNIKLYSLIFNTCTRVPAVSFRGKQKCSAINYCSLSGSSVWAFPSAQSTQGLQYGLDEKSCFDYRQRQYEGPHTRQTVCATQAVAQTVWSCVVWFDCLCNSLMICKQVWILLRNSQFVQQFEARMDMFAICCTTSPGSVILRLSYWYLLSVQGA